MSAALASVIDRSHREREDWRYTNVEKLLAAMKANAPANNDTHGLPSIIADVSQRQYIVFRNGVWQKDQSRLATLPAAILQGDSATGYRLTLAALNCLVTAPIELVFLSDGEAESHLKLSIDVGSNTSLSIIEHHLATGAGNAAQVIDTDIRLGAQAKLMHKKIVHHMAGVPAFSRTDVHVEDGAYYRHFLLAKRARLMRNEIDVTLAGSLAQCGLYGALLLGGREHVDIQTRVNHNAPHSSSQQLFKAVLKDQAHGVFQGRIKVAEGAQKTDGKQLCRALLLSDQAEMDAKPELEIYADDVACSHGCAVGDLDADAMFYLRTRGLSEEGARALLLRAFVDEVIDTVQADDTRSYVRDLAGGWMNEQG